jgi:hypothetical protein
MNVPTTMPMPVRLRPKLVIAGVAATLAAAATSVLLIVTVGTNEQTATPAEKDTPYVQAIGSLTPAQVAAAYGTQAVQGASPGAKSDYVKGISSLTQAQVAAGFGTQADDDPALSAAEKRYVDGISSLSRAERTAAFGNGR